MRTLLVMRHAKSAWPAGVVDALRPLNERGERDAPQAGRWIVDNAGVPDLILCSPAVRTRDTAASVSSVWPDPPEISYDDRIYEAHWATLVQVITEIPDEVRLALLLGHNPGLADLLSFWPESADAEANRVLEQKFPTSAIGVVDVAGSWHEPTSTHLGRIVVPRG